MQGHVLHYVGLGIRFDERADRWRCFSGVSSVRPIDVSRLETGSSALVGLEGLKKRRATIVFVELATHAREPARTKCARRPGLLDLPATGAAVGSAADVGCVAADERTAQASADLPRAGLDAFVLMPSRITGPARDVGTSGPAIDRLILTLQGCYGSRW
jgi:hypothetical protein